MEKEKILVVDDHASNRMLLRLVLTKGGYEVLEAENGREAVALAHREKPLIILLDIVMQDMDGFEVCRELKENPVTFEIPVIFLSAEDDAEARVKGLEMGGVDYITKPFHKREVLMRVRNQVQIRTLTRQLLLANKALQEKQARIEEELRIAATIQKSLLPHGPPDLETLDVAWKFMPCEMIGGDIFNLIRLNEQEFGVYMVDVCGHGLSSALVTASVSEALSPDRIVSRAKPMGEGELWSVSPSKILFWLDVEFPFDRFDKYFSMFFMTLNVSTGRLVYCNGGHPPPVILRGNRGLELMEKGGPLIGFGDKHGFEECEIQLQPGDKVIIYTDGLVDFKNQSGEYFDETGLHQELKRLSDRNIHELIEGILEAMQQFRDVNDRPDDLAVLGLEFKGAPA